MHPVAPAQTMDALRSDEKSQLADLLEIQRGCGRKTDVEHHSRTVPAEEQRECERKGYVERQRKHDEDAGGRATRM